MIFVQTVVSIAALAAMVGIIKPFGPLRTRGEAILSFLGLCLLNGLVATASAPSAASKLPAKPEASQLAGEGSLAPKQMHVAENWSYETRTDEMTGATNRWACTTSTNALDFSFPYQGGATGKLCFRRKAKALDAYIQMSEGQFSCGVEDCPLRLKFDEGVIQSYSGTESTTHESGFLFVEPESRLMNSMLKATKLKLQAQFYQEGLQVLYFDVSGLDPKNL